MDFLTLINFHKTKSIFKQIIEDHKLDRQNIIIDIFFIGNFQLDIRWVPKEYAAQITKLKQLIDDRDWQEAYHTHQAVVKRWGEQDPALFELASKIPKLTYFDLPIAPQFSLTKE